MGRYKTLAENTLIFTICNFTSKLLVFFMLPFYTMVLSKEDFGVAELIMSTALLLVPILTLCVSDGCMRYAIDKKYDNSKVFSVGFFIVSGGAILLVTCLPLLKFISISSEYILFFFLFYIAESYGILFSHFARGIDKVKLVGISGVVTSVVAVILNVLFLFIFKWGLRGYMASLIIAQTLSIIIYFLCGHLYRYVRFHFDKCLAKEILTYSIPLVPNTLSWWINSSANRFIIGYYCSVGDVGLYSASSRLPSIVSTFRGIFIQAWQLSTITEFENKDSNSFFSTIYRTYHLFVIILVSICIMLSKLMASILLSNEFFEAWVYIPFLFLSVLFGALVAFYSPTYLAHKKTKKLLLSTALGAVIAILGNFLLVPLIGVVGAAVMSAISYFTVYLYLHIDALKYVTYKTIYLRYYISYGIITLQAILITFFHMSPLSITSLICLAILLLINHQDIKLYFRFIRILIQKK